MNKLLGKNSQQIPSFFEVDGSFLTRQSDFVNYLNKYFINKVDKLIDNMSPIDINITNLLMKDNITKVKECSFKFDKVGI